MIGWVFFITVACLLFGEKRDEEDVVRPPRISVHDFAGSPRQGKEGETKGERGLYSSSLFFEQWGRGAGDNGTEQKR